jgi:hypothetical protein
LLPILQKVSDSIKFKRRAVNRATLHTIMTKISELGQIVWMNAELSSHLLVLCAASTDPWAVGWQNAGRVKGGGEQQAVPGRRACGQRLGMCNVQKPPPDNETEMKVSVFVSKAGAYLNKN